MLAVPELRKNNHPLYVEIQPQPGMREAQLYNLDEFIPSTWHNDWKPLGIISGMSEKIHWKHVPLPYPFHFTSCSFLIGEGFYLPFS